MSIYGEYIPDDWDRSDPAGELMDLSLGLPIRDVEHYGGWVRQGEYSAVRDTDHLMMMDTMMSMANEGSQPRKRKPIRPTDGDNLLLL